MIIMVRIALIFVVNCNCVFLSEEDLHIRRTQEEAVTKINVQVNHCLLNGSRNVVVKTVGTNVISKRY